MIRNVLTKILNTMLPARCLLCGTYSQGLCGTCAAKYVDNYYLHYCHVCKSEAFLQLVHRECAELTYLDGVVVSSYYTSQVKNILKEIKYSYYFEAAVGLGNLMAEKLNSYRLDVDMAIAVPLSKSRYNRRGFNQAAILASQVHTTVDSDILIRTRDTETQVGKSMQGRFENLHQAFEVRGDVSGLLILIVDDVMTTGTTLEQCAKVLKAAGAAKVYGLVLARG